VKSGHDGEKISAMDGMAASLKMGGMKKAARSTLKIRRPEPPAIRLKPAKVPGAVAARCPKGLLPQLATLSATAPSSPSWVHELKFDGYRILAEIDGGRVRL
jgi:bifunctional non-homologous end joining protein LigD